MLNKSLSESPAVRTIRTTIHYYRFSLDKPEEATAYKALCARLREDGRHFFNVLGGKHDPRFDASYADNPRETEQTEDIELETAHIFADQWNSTTARVFDWYEAIWPNKKVKTGHYLDITDEMRAIRRDTLVCGYCGKQVLLSEPHGAFCDRCLDSEYIKENDLHLLRLLPAGLFMPKRAELTESEHAQLMPRYISRQTTGNDSRAVQAKARIRRNVEEKHKKALDAAETEYKGFIWLLDRDINTENCIYYSHTDKFSFGWRSPVSAAVKSALLDLLTEFPFEYEIKS